MEAAGASSRDLLQRVAGSTILSDRPPQPEAAPSAAGDDIELCLGLSLGGCFSPTPREKTNKLIRSSSVSWFPFLDCKVETFQVAPAPLQRTCSLPGPVVDEDYRKRKELQSLTRSEAKKKRSEKRNSLKGGDESGGGFQWQPASWRPPISQGSIGSVGSSSSVQGSDSVRFSSCSEARSPLVPDQPSPRPPTDETGLEKVGRRGSGVGGMGRVTVEQMPCVSTRGSGPDGRRIEGFLYEYRKGEEVRIVCVCHGSFLTPAEFVSHAGGGDVDHPLRHIVVSPPSPFL